MRRIRPSPLFLANTAPGRLHRAQRNSSSRSPASSESWVAGGTATQRAYRQDVMAFIRFRQIAWPEDATALFHVFGPGRPCRRDQLVAAGRPQNPEPPDRLALQLLQVPPGRGCRAAAADHGPNPAHAQFLGRDAADPREETRALSATRARQLMGLPSGDTVFDYRDRAILKFYLYRERDSPPAAGSASRISSRTRTAPPSASPRRAPAAARSASTSPPPRPSKIHRQGRTHPGPLFRPRRTPASQSSRPHRSSLDHVSPDHGLPAPAP